MDGNNYPKLHNAMWPGLVGKGPDSEPPIDLDTMLELTAAAEVDGDQVRRRRPVSVPIRTRQIDSTRTTISSAWPTRSQATGSRRLRGRAGLAAGRRRLGDGRSAEERKQFLDHGREGVPHRATAPRHRHPARTASSASTRRAGSHDWATDPAGNQKLIAETFSEACDVAERPRRAPRGRRRDLLGRHAQLEAHGAICWSGRSARDARLPGRHGAHAALHARLQRPRGTASCPKDYDWEDRKRARRGAARSSPHALRPWTIDFHVAQNDATVKGSGSHDKTGRHCLVERPERQARYHAPRRLLAARRRRAN